MGIFPVNWLLPKASIARLDIEPNIDGRLPVNELYVRLIATSDVMTEIEEGIKPVSALYDRYNDSRSVSKLIDSGSDLDKQL